MTISIPSFRGRSAISALCLSALLLVVGCAKPVGKVSGKVLLNGEPLKGGGSLTFAASRGGASGSINPDDGTYTLSKVPVGDVTIVLESGWSDSPKSAAPKAGPTKTQEEEPSGKVLEVRRVGRGPFPLKNIPAKYSKPETSGLTYTVKPGDQTFDIQLTK